MDIDPIAAKRDAQSDNNFCLSENLSLDLLQLMFVDHLMMEHGSKLENLLEILSRYKALNGSVQSLREEVFKKIIAISSRDPATALILNVDVSYMPPSKRQEYKNRLKQALSQVKNNLNLDSVTVFHTPLPVSIAISSNAITQKPAISAEKHGNIQ